MLKMQDLNNIWKEHTGADLTPEEAWKMVEFVNMVYQEADKRIDKEINK